MCGDSWAAATVRACSDRDTNEWLPKDGAVAVTGSGLLRPNGLPPT